MTAITAAAITGTVMMGTGIMSATLGLAGGYDVKTGCKVKPSPNAISLTRTFPTLTGCLEIQAPTTVPETIGITKLARVTGRLAEGVFGLTGGMFKLTGGIYSSTTGISSSTGDVPGMSSTISNQTRRIGLLTGTKFTKPQAFSVNQKH